MIKVQYANVKCLIYLYTIMYILYIKYEKYIKTLYFSSTCECDVLNSLLKLRN